MNEQLDLLMTLRSNIDVIAKTLLANKDLTGETLPKLDRFDFDVIQGAEEVTRGMMYKLDPTTDPSNEESK